MEIITEKPLWFLVLCLLLGAVYTWLLYSNRRFKSENGKWNFSVVLMSGIRFFATSLLAFFLLSPLIKHSTRILEKPIIVFAQDNSESVPVNKDSSYYRDKYPAAVEALLEGFGDDYKVEFYTFGNQISEEKSILFNQKQTNLSGTIDELYNRYDNLNLGALIIASDGIFNQGSNPVYNQRKLKTHIYTVALGDTSIQKDVILKKVRYNRTAFLGNNFPLEIDLSAYGYKGGASQVTITHKGKTIFNQNVFFDKPRFNLSIPVNLAAEEKGMQRYTVSIGKQSGEISYSNNSKEVFIDVLDGKQKILLLALCAHPDLAALKSAIENNQNYECDIALADGGNEWISKLNAYNLLILHQIPGKEYSTQNIFEQLKNSKLPRLYITGSQSQLSIFNSLNAGISIQNNGGNTNDATALLNKSFGLFTLSPEASDILKKLPPLQVPFGSYATAVGTQVMCYQQVGYTATQMPLIAFSQTDGIKYGIVAGEGLWRWRLTEYQIFGNQNISTEIITKAVQYLCARDDRRLLRITTDRKTFDENEKIMLTAEVYNPSYELITTPDVQFKVTNEAGKVFTYVFNKGERSYNLDAGILPVGNNSYVANTTVSGKNETVSGAFTVLPLQAEFIESTADHNLLNNLARQYNGEMVYPAQMNSLIEKIKNQEDVKPVSYTQLRLQDLINIKWIFFLLLSLISLEWLVRKREGSY